MASRHRAAADVARCDGYAWNLRDKLGKGSYGDVYKGWNNKVSRLIRSADEKLVLLSIGFNIYYHCRKL